MKNFSLLFLCLITALAAFAQDSIPNPGFERWTNYGSYVSPNNWTTLNFNTAIADSFTCVQDSTNVHSGKYSIELISKPIPIAGQVVPGILTNGVVDLNTATISGGMVIHSRPTAVKGWFQYPQPAGLDTGAVRVQMLGPNGNIGFGYFLFTQAVNTWTPFTVNIDYSSADVPDTFQIVFITSVSNNTLPQTTLFVDDLSFTFPGDQCGITKTLTQTGGLCSADTLQVWNSSSASQIVWVYNNSVDSVNNAVAPTSGITVAGNALRNTGLADTLLNGPTFTFLDKQGNLYVSDYNNNRVQKFAPGATTGVTVAGDTSGNSGPAANLLNRPQGIYVDTSGNLFVSDCYNHRVQKWAPGATSGVTVAGDSSGNSGISDSLLAFPSGIWMDASENLYIADNTNNRVQKWAPGAAFGTTVAGSASGNNGISDSLFSGPWSVFVDGSNNLFIADRGNNRVQKWSPGATTGTTVAGDSLGSAGLGAAQLNNPEGAFVDQNGNLFVADAANNRIQKWAPSAIAGVTVAGDSAGNSGISDSLFSVATWVWVDAGGAMYISDYSNNRVQKWAGKINTNLIITAPGTYTAVITDANGCVDTTNVSLADTLPHPVISANQATGSTGNYYSYQWLLSGNAITGANSSSFTATTTGSYQVIVTNANGCVDTSAAVTITVSGIHELSAPEISIYPNPTENMIHLQCDNLGGNTTFELRDAIGRIMYTQNTNTANFIGQIDLSLYANGVYLLTIRSANMATVTKQVVKD